MPRKGHIAKRDVLADPIYNSKLVTRLINRIMIDGKRGTAQTILYNAFEIVGEKCKSVICPVRRLFISSGHGEYLSYVRRPAST